MYLESDSLRVSYSIELGFRVQGKSDSVQFYRKGPPCQLVASEWHRSALNCTKNAGQIAVPRGNLSAAFSLLLFVALHPQVQPLAHLVEEVGAAVVLAAFHVRIGVIAMTLLDFQSERRIEKSDQLVNRRFALVDAMQLLQPVNQLDQLHDRSRPAMRSFRV